jgi:hypothetical protein
MKRRTWITVAPVLAMLAVGCATQPNATSAPAPATKPAAAPSSPTTTTTTTTASQPTNAPTVAAPAVAAPAAAPTLGLFDGVPHGVTPDGFYFLGQPNAPVTMTDYSDFL